MIDILSIIKCNRLHICDIDALQEVRISKMNIGVVKRIGTSRMTHILADYLE